MSFRHPLPPRPAHTVNNPHDLQAFDPRILSDPARHQEVINRRMVFCAGMLGTFQPATELVVQCTDCKLLHLLCCSCLTKGSRHFEQSGGQEEFKGNRCHYYRVVFVDGACSRNGSPYARAAIGLVMGGDPQDYHSFPIVSDCDPVFPRTNQRTELLAAVSALRLMLWEKEADVAVAAADPTAAALEHAKDNSKTKCFVIATDSMWMVESVTEHYPKWKARNWTTTTGQTPRHLDLFHTINDLIIQLQQQHDLTVGFWHIPRECNTFADQLAGAALNLPDIVWFPPGHVF